METSPWSRRTINRLVDLMNTGADVETLATLLDDELDTDDSRVQALPPHARHRYCVLAVTTMLADHWRRRLDVEIASAKADGALSWRLIASATGRDDARAVMMSARRIAASPARRHRTPPRPLVPRDDEADDVDDTDQVDDADEM